jgi:hypothetical protein
VTGEHWGGVGEVKIPRGIANIVSE